MEGARSIGTPGRRSERTLLPPDAVRRALPVSREGFATVQVARESLRALLHGRDRHRLAVMVGPCSIHDPEAALDYARRLRRLAETLAGELVVVMRTFVEKPRTRQGWKGLVNDPHLDGSCDVGLGLASARGLLVRVNEIGLPCAVELLEPFTAPYLEDLVAWGAVGARTSESPVHRQLASGVPFPVGFKNGTDGSLQAAAHALHAAGAAQSYAAVGPDGRCVVRETAGNPDTHLVLRGGRSGPNFDEVSIAAATRLTAERGLARSVLVDCSHDNSGSDPSRQAQACRGALDALRAGAPGLLGVMLESSLEAGRQDPGTRPLRYGVSITDACIDWNETADLLCEIAEAVKLSR
jgi:3-deoxy-7-phosphoheptulonate synthase